MRTIDEKARKTPVILETDVLVVGGGPSGINAAIAAKRLGMDVTLLEANGFLGGTLTSVTLGNICGLYAAVGDELIPMVQGIASELVERLKKREGVSNPRRWKKAGTIAFDVLSMKIVYDEMISEAGVRLLCHVLATDVIMDGNAIKGVIIESKAGREAIMAKVVVDASGDADIAARAGAPFHVIPVAQLQYPTTMFRWSNVDTAAYVPLSREQLTECLEKAIKAGIELPRTNVAAHVIRAGEVHCNVTRVPKEDGSPINPLDPWELTYAEVMGRKQVMQYQEAFRRFVPGFQNGYVNDTGASIGIRESRLIQGEYTLTEEDVLGYHKHDDGVACTAWPIEIHGAGYNTEWIWFDDGEYYNIPLGTLIPLEVENLLVSGRSLSSTHVAHASARCGAMAMALGQASGTAAAVALKTNTPIRKVDIAKVQEELVRAGAKIK